MNKEAAKQQKYAAIVTGASSGIGWEIAKMLCRLGYEVYGIGRNFPEADYGAKGEFLGRFHTIVCNMLDTEKFYCMVKELEKQVSVQVLVNNAGTAYYGLHEELNEKKIQEMVRLNLEAPMLLTQLFLRKLKENQGYIINISSVTATEVNPHGAAYGATKAGLFSFSKSLFAEARKYGVRVITIAPDMTQTKLYRNADFETDEALEAYLLPKEVAQAAEYALMQRDGLVVSEITLRPQLHRIKRKRK